MDLNFLSNNSSDNFIDHIRILMEIHIALKGKYEKAMENNKFLETELAQLKSPSSKLNANIIKRRKTESPTEDCDKDKTFDCSLNDAFNTAIQDKSLQMDDEVISATPRPHIKKENLKENRRRKPIIQKQEDQCDTFEPNESKSILNEATITKSPLKFANTMSPSRSTKILPSKSHQTETTPKIQWKSKIKTPSKHGINNLFLQQEKPPTLPIVNSKSPQIRQNLSSKKHLRQSRLGFIIKSEPHQDDTDATFCADILSDAPIGNTDGGKGLISNKDSDDLFNFSSTERKDNSDEANNLHKNSNEKLNIKIEKPTPLKGPSIKNVNHSSNDDDPINSLISNSSSVFAIPNQTDEIIFLDDTQNIFDTSDLLNYMKKDDDDDEHIDQIHRQMRYGTPIRKKAEKDVMPGFECPECAPYYKFIGVAMTNKEIQDRIDKCSRHKRNVNLNATPEGFWIPYFLPTQKGVLDESLVDYRFVNRNIAK